MMQPPCRIDIKDSRLGYMGCVVVDAFVRKTACGGIRVKIGSEEMMAHAQEAALLARVMTLKFGFHEIPQGGAKGVIVLPNGIGREERDRRFRIFGEKLGPFLRKGTLKTGQDMGMTERDLHFLGVGAGLKKDDAVPGDEKRYASGEWTATGIVASLEAAAKLFRWEMDRLEVIIEGFGAVGSSLAGLLAGKGVRVVGVSTKEGGLYHPTGLDVACLLRLRDQYGDGLVARYDGAQRMAPAQLLGAKADILFPCAGLYSVNGGNAQALRVKTVIAGANCALDEAAIRFCEENGILFIPGFVANAGSVLKTYLAKSQGVSSEKMEAEIRRLMGLRVTKWLQAGQDGGYYQTAVRIAEENRRRMTVMTEPLIKKICRKFLFQTAR